MTCFDKTVPFLEVITENHSKTKDVSFVSYFSLQIPQESA